MDYARVEYRKLRVLVTTGKKSHALGLAGVFQQLCAELILNVEICHIVDESPLRYTIRDGEKEAEADALSYACCSMRGDKSGDGRRARYE